MTKKSKSLHRHTSSKGKRKFVKGYAYVIFLILALIAIAGAIILYLIYIQALKIAI